MDLGGKMFDPNVVETIMLGAMGLTVLGITEMLKKLFKANGAVAYLLSFIVSAGGTLYYLIGQSIFTLPSFIGYTIIVFLSANGIYKATRGPYA
jgi:hypothetical protein